MNAAALARRLSSRMKATDDVEGIFGRDMWQRPEARVAIVEVDLGPDFLRKLNPFSSTATSKERQFEPQ